MYLRIQFQSANFVAGRDIVVTDEDTVIDEDFKRFIYVFSTDKDGSIDKYYRFEVNRDNISLPPEKLEENINYIGPVMGDLDRTTKFTMLDSAYGFMYMIADKEMSIPALDANFSSKGISLAQDQGIEAKAGDYLLLLAVDDGKVQAYAQFRLTEDQIKGITPPKFTFTPEKGNGPGTTRVRGIELDHKDNKWMYALGTNLIKPELDRVYAGAKDYDLGQDIVAEIGQSLMILETDSTGRVKRFGIAALDENNVKAGLANKLELGPHLKEPVKGSKVGTIKFEFLKYQDYDFILIKSQEAIPVPEMDSIVSGYRIGKDGFGTEDIRVYEENDEKLRSEEGFRDFAMVLAVDEDNKVKAYYGFELNRDNVKLPEAGQLNDGGLVNYELTKGDLPNTTKVSKLDSTGLLGVSSFRYRVIDEGIKLEYNTIISGTSQLRENANIPASIGKYLLILAVDSAGRTKYYDTVLLTEDILRYSNAPLLRVGTNFLDPVPGDDFNSTKISFLRLPEGASKWMYAVLDTSYDPVEFNRPIELEGIEWVEVENVQVEINQVSPNQWLLLLAVDKKAGPLHYNLRLGENHARP